MFLATTANQNFWKTDEPILFLGEWCRLYSQKHVWSELDYKVLPYHGANRLKAHQDYRYSQEVYERTLNELSQQLNDIHNVNYSVKYWRILLGFWLASFIQICLDRYRSISQAIESGKVKNTYVGEYDYGAFTPGDSGEFRDFFCSDAYNHFLYDFFIKSLNGFRWEVKVSERLKNKSVGGQTIHRLGFKDSIIKAMGHWSKLVSGVTQSVVFFNSYIPPVGLIRLQLTLGQIPSPYWMSSGKYTTVGNESLSINFVMRERLRLKKSDDLFENLVKKLIHVQIPKVYMEGYRETNRAAMEVFPKKTKVIITATHNTSELFKFWAGYQVDQGTKLILTQHGGNIGDGLWSSNDDRELAIANRYFTWGWSRKDTDKTVAVPAPMLDRIKGQIRPDHNGNILCITSSFPRYPYAMAAMPTSSLVLDALSRQDKFFNSVSQEVYKLLVLRLFPVKRGWDEKMRWMDIQSSLKTYRGTKTMYDQLNESRLCVCFYNGTPMLEGFASNFPTVVFFNPKNCELNESAQPYFDALREAGILFDDPESAASQINKIYQDPVSWWKTTRVQRAKNRFCDRYARCESNWISKWKKEILKVINE
jgi:putative transferase (TIGR04331 family)